MSLMEDCESDDDWSINDITSSDEEEQSTTPTVTRSSGLLLATQSTSTGSTGSSTNLVAPATATSHASPRTTQPTQSRHELIMLALHNVIHLCELLTKRNVLTGPDEEFLSVLRYILRTKRPEDKVQFNLKVLEMARQLPYADDYHGSPSHEE